MKREVLYHSPVIGSSGGALDTAPLSVTGDGAGSGGIARSVGVGVGRGDGDGRVLAEACASSVGTLLRAAIADLSPILASIGTIEPSDGGVGEASGTGDSIEGSVVTVAEGSVVMVAEGKGSTVGVGEGSVVAIGEGVGCSCKACNQLGSLAEP